MQELAGTASSIFFPVAAAGLLAFTDLRDILWIDVATFGMAITSSLPLPQLPLDLLTNGSALDTPPFSSATSP